MTHFFTSLKMLVPTYNNPFGLGLLLSWLGSPEIAVTKSWLMVSTAR